MTLNSYNFNVIYQPGKENYPADSLSRLLLQETSKQSELPNHAKLLHLRVRNLPMKRSHLKRETMNDSTLSNVIRCLQTCWPEKKNLHRDLVPFYEKRTELSFEEDLLLWKGRICVSLALQPEVLGMLHHGHPGITAMQSLAKLHVFWPNINSDIALEIEKCFTCQQSMQNDRNSPLHPWGISPEPWSRLHLDFAGPLENQNFMEGEGVWVNNPLSKGSLLGKIVKRTGPLSYLVEIDGILRRKHCDQMRKRKLLINTNEPSHQDMSDGFEDDQSSQLHQSASCDKNESSLNDVEAGGGELNNVDHSLSRECIMPRRNPFRIRKPPSRFSK
ncbi:hypothetical protein JTB14_016254 [Gonioctena quinquepunctata]|nr:hypothetical protein JTB14_016254 [Gonioctena quinquepunctata]